jgi:glycosyltransferase involved in cell wall biosynthesis
LSGQLKWLGVRDDVGELMAAADVFLLPSREDPFPNVVIEALAAGTPVVAFADTGGAPEALTDGAGVVVPYLDVDAMAQAAFELMVNPNSCQSMRRAALAAAERYSFQSYYEAIRRLIVSAIKSESAQSNR